VIGEFLEDAIPHIVLASDGYELFAPDDCVGSGRVVFPALADVCSGATPATVRYDHVTIVVKVLSHFLNGRSV
jgi:hypothetical protein